MCTTRRGFTPIAELFRAAISTAWSRAAGPRWWEMAIRRGSRILVAVAGEDVVGYGSYGRNRAGILPVGGEIYELYVRPEFQGLGLGRRLFQACRRELGSRGVKGLAVWALADNGHACEFYRNIGGTNVARGSETFGDVTLEKLAFTWS